MPFYYEITHIHQVLKFHSKVKSVVSCVMLHNVVKVVNFRDFCTRVKGVEKAESNGRDMSRPDDLNIIFFSGGLPLNGHGQVVAHKTMPKFLNAIRESYRLREQQVRLRVVRYFVRR